MFCFVYLKKLFIFIVLFVFIAGCMYYMSPHICQQKKFSYKINVMNHINHQHFFEKANNTITTVRDKKIKKAFGRELEMSIFSTKFTLKSF